MPLVKVAMYLKVLLSTDYQDSNFIASYLVVNKYIYFEAS